MFAAVFCSQARAADPVTITFSADRDVAGVGERVGWTVWAELPAGAPAGARIRGIFADFIAGDPAAGEAVAPTPLVYAEQVLPGVAGPGLRGVELVCAMDLDTPGDQPGDQSGSSAGAIGLLPRRLPLYAFSTIVATADRPIAFDVDATLVVAGPTGLTFHSRSGGTTHWGRPIVVDSDTVNTVGCGLADIAHPWGVIDMTDLSRFVGFFQAAAPMADVAAPFGVVDFADLLLFMERYTEPCGSAAG